MRRLRGARAAPAVLAGLAIAVGVATAAPPAASSLGPADRAGVRRSSGTIVGDTSRDFVLTCGAGQTLVVKLRAKHPAAYFNLLPPGSENVASFIGSLSGARFEGRAPIAGEYRLRVYLLRSAARRGERSAFELTVSVRGESLQPLEAARDARVPGSVYHARGAVRCGLPYQSDVKQCDAGVIRYARDGTATVELRGPNGFLRRLLFVKGELVATDASSPARAARASDSQVVTIGDEERYELPDALLLGG